MFPKINRSDADKTVLKCIKYLFNYGFYKFGFEICVITIVIVIGVRLDFYAVFYLVWLSLLIGVKRTTTRRMWKLFFMDLSVIIPIQYFQLIGLPPVWCTEIFLDTHEQPANKLLLDLFLFILVSRQALAFEIETKFAGIENPAYAGGSNESIIHHANEPNFLVPVPDFISYSRPYLDFGKRAVFLSWMWITLAIMFLAGTYVLNVFSIGYLIGSFVFLWRGSDLYLYPIPKILKSWNMLIAYNIFVIFVKTIVAIFGCIYYHELNRYACWVVQLFAVGCANGNVKDISSADETCTVPEKYVGVVWDGLLFAFLIFQRRIFHSYNFFHIVNETKATKILASRGAELIEELTHKRIIERQEGEKEVLEKIKQKMKRIKSNRQNLVGSHYKDNPNHHIETSNQSSQKNTLYKDVPPYTENVPKDSNVLHAAQNHYWFTMDATNIFVTPINNTEPIRSGDYYMFDEVEDEELELIGQPEDHSLDDDDEEIERSLGRTVTAMELISTAMKSNISTELKDSEIGVRRRRSSMPSTRQRSIFSDPPVAVVGTDRVVLIDPKEIKERQTGTSKDEDEEISELSEAKEFISSEKILHYLTFAWLFIERCCLTLTIFLNKYSKDYRYILRVLNEEKQFLKERTQYYVGLRLGTGEMWKPAESYHALLQHSLCEGKIPSEEQPPIIKLLLAIWYIILSHSHILCFFIIFLNQMESASYLTLPLPMMVLFGAIVLVKYIFQFEMIPWNKYKNMPRIFPPRIIGIEKKDDYAHWDLLLLLAIFFHRFLMQCLGLWKSAYIPEVILTDGNYEVTKEESKTIEDEGMLPILLTPTGDSSFDSYSHLKTFNLRKGNDLENLVEEPHEGNEEEREERNKELVSVVTKKLTPGANLAIAIRLGFPRYGGAITSFLLPHLFDPSYRIAVDVYAYMFLCDFLNLFVILFGYSSFWAHTGDETVSDYLTENKIPSLFLIMLIIQFLLIIIDRAIFLRKHLFAKIIFQFLQIVFLHLWLFILYPFITDRICNSAVSAQIFYMVKCFYLLLSAYQIRSGYPSRVSGNFICRSYSYFNLSLYKVFFAIPFLFELRMIMDWMWTDTSMSIFDWINMEHMFAHIFIVKCNRLYERQYPQPRGEKKETIIKYLMGGGALLAMFVIIWFPLVIFALLNTVGLSNIPYSATMELRIGPYEPIYRMTAQTNSIIRFTDNDYNRLLGAYEQSKSALTFIANYQPSDVAVINFSKDSASVWSISPSDRLRMIAELNASYPIRLSLRYFVSHKSNAKEDSGSITGEVVATLIDTHTHKALLNMLIQEDDRAPVVLKYMVPQFIKITSKGAATPISHLMKVVTDSRDATFRHILVQHRKGSQMTEWWRLAEVANDTNYYKILQHIPHYEAGAILIYSFNDKLFPQTLNLITTGGIIGIYTTMVFVLGRLLRTVFFDVCFKLMLNEFLYVDRMLQLCYDIYLVRDAREYVLEEDLFAKLLFLFRSPETLIKWTRLKKEVVAS
ncbi:hypothetical protein RI129_004387 [Pyrocoelia pectoralis]|uniref:Piezo non-specific cation channel R-Ras-binding domain-containing protein n=1 Tax=Pyrocoelia pectoralis TaxID=417401 RepID=A0AAN7ZQ24_9COLE